MTFNQTTKPAILGKRVIPDLNFNNNDEIMNEERRSWNEEEKMEDTGIFLGDS